MVGGAKDCVIRPPLLGLQSNKRVVAHQAKSTNATDPYRQFEQYPMTSNEWSVGSNPCFAASS